MSRPDTSTRRRYQSPPCLPSFPTSHQCDRQRRDDPITLYAGLALHLTFPSQPDGRAAKATPGSQSQKSHFFLLWLQHRPGRARSGCQVSYVTLSSAIFSQAQRNSRVAHAWRLHLIMCGVVTPDHSQPSLSLTPPPRLNPANSAVCH